MANPSLTVKTNPKGATLHSKQLRTLYRISNILSSGKQQKEALREALGMLDKELGMHRGTVTLLAPARDEILIEVRIISQRNRAEKCDTAWVRVSQGR